MTALASDLTGLGMAPAVANRIGHTTTTADPTNVLVPAYIGQEVLDTTNSIWYKSVGTLAANWKAMNT